MNVFFLSDMKGDTKKRLQRVLEYMLPKKNIQYIKSVRELEENLRKSSHKMSLAVILQVSKAKLSSLLPIKALLEDTSIILILNDKDDETIALGHRLRPRFMTCADSDFLDVASVLIKMKEKMLQDEARK
ncbi:MAG: hypothetical protein CVU71_16700 [Deltaproteobacteria bacterium HGW-Deltaproteobacteria-6]|jgi:hypothetical protein|nr:MAG: hypothetical protein CVU71_16700 [Deltaproteobacteria bacterium HGW-Deltaproteobacteria-6]